MRHLRSILYALVLAPAAWILAGVGFTHDLVSRGRDMFAAESVSGLLLLLFAGILYAIMVFAPISPAGPTLAGATYLGVTYWAWSAPESYAGAWPPDVVKADFDLSRPGYGLAAMLAVPLLCTALSARRWARYEPPVLPIIGEIGRFRGSAKVAGETVASAETTVLRTAQPVPSRLPADPTVAIPAQAPLASRGAPLPAQDDKTQLLRTASGEPTVPLVPADATVAFSAVKAPVATPQPPVAPVTPNSNKSGFNANPAIAAEARKTAAKPAVSDAGDDKTVAMMLPAEDKTVATRPPAEHKAEDKTVAMTLPVMSAPAADGDKTTVIPAQRSDGPTEPLKKPDDEETEVLSAAALVTPPAKDPEVAKLPAATEA
jgi:hypothetical protein